MEQRLNEAREQHSKELSRKNEEIRDLSALNDEALKTANEATFSEKAYKSKIKKLTDDLSELRRDVDHKERCYTKIQKDNDQLRDENKTLQQLVHGTKAEEMKKMQLTVDEKDRQI